MKFQIGKSGITAGILESLQNAFKTHKKIRVHTLKTSNRDREKIKEMAEELVSKLQGNYNYKIVGFTIIMKKVSAGKVKRHLNTKKAKR